jgi:MoaA/NifB/PqqE/SkfB family radical SAM enzyme
MNTLYCAAPFRSIRIDSTNNTQQTRYRPCCVYKDQTDSSHTLTHYLQRKEIADLKQYFLSDPDRLPAGCESCHNQEQQNLPGQRTYFNKKFQDHQDCITQIEILPSNVCNLKCFMCSPSYSTALGHEYQQLKLINQFETYDYEEDCIQAITTLPDLSSVTFIGGEFFLTKQNLKILDLLIAKQISVQVTTNATVLLDSQIQRLKQIRDLELTISIDGIGPSYEFMRYPAKWSEVDSNIRYLKQILPHARLIINFVCQPLNVQYLIPTMDYINQLMITTHISNLITPIWLEWHLLTQLELQQIQKLLQEQLTQYKLTISQRKTVDTYIKQLSTVQSHAEFRIKFVERMQLLLTHRKISTTQILEHFGILSDLGRQIISIN